MQSNKAYAVLLLTAIFWAGNAIAGKMAVGHISPLLLSSMRWLLALAVLLPFAWTPLRRDWPVIKPHLLLFVLLAMFGFSVFSAAIYTALEHTSAVNVSLEQAAIPMVIIVLNFLLFGIRTTWLQVLGFLFSVLGVALTVGHGEPLRLLQLDVNIGDAIMLGGVVLNGLYAVLLPYKPAVNWLSTITVLVVTAFVTSIPFAAWEYAAGALIFPDLQGWAVLFFIAIFPSVVAQVLFIRGVELIGGNRAGLMVNLVPIFGTFLSILVLGEQFHLYHAIAVFLVFFGISIAEYSGRKAARPVPSVRTPLED